MGTSGENIMINRQIILRAIQVVIVLVTLLLIVTRSFAAVVKDLKSSQVGNRILFKYDLIGEAETEGKVGVNVTVGGQTYKSDKLHLEGDFGKIKAGKGKKLWWNVLQDFPKGVSGEFFFRIDTNDHLTEKDIVKPDKRQEILKEIDSLSSSVSGLTERISFTRQLQNLSEDIQKTVLESYMDEVDASTLEKLKIYCAAFVNYQGASETIEKNELAVLVSKSTTIADDRFEKYINCYLGLLDPHSSWMSPESYSEMKIDTKGRFGGLGIEISIKEGILTVVSPIEDTPAYQAGIKAGDQIIRIDQKPTKGLTILEAVKRLRGVKGTTVTVTVMREGFDKPREFLLTRDTIQVKSVKYKELDSGYGYIKIAQFQEKTSDDLANALNVLQTKNGKLRGLVLDLRNDPGGLLDQAVRVAEKFVDDGNLIVYTDGRENQNKMKFFSRKGEKEPKYPIVVLINSGSASASEIVTGALQDHKRALIMGSRSFGKGSVQTILPLSNGSALRLTTARYYTPKGRSIQAQGITPDVHVEPGMESEDAELAFAQKFLREAEAVEGHEKRMEFASKLRSRDTSMLGLSSKMHVFPAPPNLTGRIDFFDASGNGILEAEEKGGLKVALINNGKGDAFDVYLDIRPDKRVQGLTNPAVISVGTIPAGSGVTKEIPLTASENITGTEVQFTIATKEANGFDAPPMALVFKTRELASPQLQVAKVDIESADGGRVIKKGMQATIALNVQNVGQGAARGVVAVIASGDRNVVLYDAEPIEIGTLHPGETKKASFSLAVTQRYQGGKELPVTFSLREERERFKVAPDVQLTLNQEAPVLQVVKVAARETAPIGVPLTDDSVPSIPPEERAFTQADQALVIGIERYRNKLPPSLFSYRDARLIKEYLLALGFSERNIDVLTDENATLTDIRTAVERKLKNRVKPESRIFVYYSGHGAPEPATGNAYLVPYDGDPNYIDATGYPLRQLYESLGKLKAKEVLVILDSCFSGAGSGGNSRTVLAQGARPLVMMADPVAMPVNMAVLSATSGSQISTTYTEKEQGLLTWYLLKGIREGKGSLDELYSWLKPQVEDEARRQNVEQSPALMLGAPDTKARLLLRR